MKGIKAMGGIKLPTTRFYIISKDTGSKFLAWYKKIASKLQNRHEVYVYEDISKVKFGNPRDINKIIIAPGVTISKEQKLLLKKKNAMRIHIDQYYENSQLPKIIRDEL